MDTELVKIMRQAAYAGAQVVNTGQRGHVGIVETKIGDGNNTVVTKWDKESEKAILSILKPTGINIRSEEKGFVPNAGSANFADYLWIVDPLDGSKPFAIKADTSTVSVALFNTKHRQVEAVAVAAVATGKVWLAVAGAGFWVYQINSGGVSSLVVPPSFVDKQTSLGKESIVLVDCYRDFKLADHPVTPNEVWGAFMADLFVNTSGVYAMGSNCLHHALVAEGGKGVVGAITTCRGGPHDITPVLLVLQAGGVAQGYSNRDGTLRKVNPLDVENCNFMISAATPVVLETLMKLFEKHVG